MVIYQPPTVAGFGAYLSQRCLLNTKSRKQFRGRVQQRIFCVSATLHLGPALADSIVYRAVWDLPITSCHDCKGIQLLNAQQVTAFRRIFCDSTDEATADALRTALQDCRRRLKLGAAEKGADDGNRTRVFSLGS
jgi:hypothetical protein